MILAQPRLPLRLERRQALADARTHRQLDRMALAVVEADGFRPRETCERPGQADGGILAAGEQHEGGFVALSH